MPLIYLKPGSRCSRRREMPASADAAVQRAMSANAEREIVALLGAD
jgi:hypothetical protein